MNAQPKIVPPFAGDYVDMKFIKTRSVAQIHIEIPIDQAAAFIAAYGAPNPAEGVPVAIARLDLSAAKSDAPEKQRQKWSDMPPAKQAAIRCGEPAFWKYLSQRSDMGHCNDAQDAAQDVREICGVISRAELDKHPTAAARWKELEDAYWAWSRGYEQ